MKEINQSAGDRAASNASDVASANGAGTLYLCATPIGNLEDMTYRAVRMLGEAPLIAAEDTRHTRQLLAHFGIHTRLTSYHEHNKFEKGPELIEYLLAGNDLVCVSDAGLPGICDPGAHLAELAIAAGIRVSPLPGANAGLSALICSGLDTTLFTFVGFLPKTSKKQRETLAKIKNYAGTLIFYEAPHHLRATLAALLDGLGDREAVLGRELTKRFEEFRRGPLSELIAYYEENDPRGEYVILVSGADESAASDNEDAATADPVELCKTLITQGLDKKSAMRETAKKLGLSRRDVYQALLAADAAE